MRYYVNILCMAEKKEKSTEKDYYECLVDKVIEAYRKLLNQGMALDVCRVQGKMRAMILRDSRFIAETRAIRAEKYLHELNEVEDIYEAASRLGDDDSDYDYSGRDNQDGRKKKGKTSDKDALAMQLKAAAMRRELMSLTAEDTGDNEESAVNFFFTALTAEEMEHMKAIEVHHGSSSDSDTFKSLASSNENDVASQAKKRKEQTKQKMLPEEEDASIDSAPSSDEDIFETLPDGTVRVKE